MKYGMRRGAALALLAAAAALPAAARAADAPYEIGAILSLTGNGAFLGQTEQRSLQILEKTVNAEGGIKGRQVKFVFFDDQSSPQLAVQLAGQVIANRPAAMLGPSLVATCNAMAPLTKAGPVAYCLSPGVHPAADSYVFTATVATRDGEEALVRYFRSRGLTRLAFIASTDATGHEAEGDFKEVLKLPENKDVELVALEHFTPGDISAMAQMERIKAAKPQALFAWSTGAPVATLFKGIIQAGLDLPVATTNGNMTYQQMLQYADFLPKELYLPASLWLSSAQGIRITPDVDIAGARFYIAFKSAGQQPDTAATLPWDPAMVIIDGLRQLGPDASAGKLHHYITHLKNYAGVQGVYDFEKTPQRGLNVEDAVVTRWTPTEKIWKIVSKPTGVPAEQ